MVELLAFLAGLLVGSFLNVCVHRLPRDLSVVRPRSFCPACARTVAWYDNIPLVSFLLLKGCCRYCGARIGWRYPVVELLTALVFLLAVFQHGAGLQAAKLAVFGALLVGLVFADIETRILPDEMTLGGLVAGVVLSAYVPLHAGLLHIFFPDWGPRILSVAESVLGAGVSSFALWGVGALYFKIRGREGLGFGDVKMVAMIGAFLGLHGALLTIMLGSLAGSVLGLAYILATRKAVSTYELPFGSFLGAAALFIAFWRG